MKKLLDDKNTPADVDALSRRSHKKTRPKTWNQKSTGKCTRCGYESNHTKKDCPARDEKCNICSKKGHFSKVCRERGNRKGNLNEVEEAESSEDSDDVFLGAITSNIDTVEDWQARVCVGD